MAENIQRLVEVHQCIQGQAGGVFQAVFVADFCRQFAVGAGLFAQLVQLCQQVGVGGEKACDAEWVFGIQHRAVGQHQADASQGVVGVVRRAAAHAAGVVGNDATDLAGVDRRRVRANLALEGRQNGIRLSANYARLQADLAALTTDFPTVPVVAQHDQHRVADGLAGQAGAGGAEGYGYAVHAGQLEQVNHFQLCLDAHHQFGNQSVEAGIGAKSQGRQRVVEAPFGWDQVLDGGEKGGRQAHAGSESQDAAWCSSRTSESAVISLIDLAPVSTMATRISFSISSSRLLTPAPPAAARA